MTFNPQLLTPPSGFPDLGPKMKIAEQRVLDVIRKHYEAAGFLPIETPLVERTEVLTAKSDGEIGTQIYGLRLLNPAPDAPTDEKSLALRFDQTVPLARFIAANRGTLTFPFRRYVTGPVFRGERPKAGRYRQFTQADIDTVGDGALDVLHDAEVIATMAHIFTELNIGDFTLRINNRKVLEGLIKKAGVADIATAIAIVDRAEKVPVERTTADLVGLGMSEAGAKDLHGLLTRKRTAAETLWVIEGIEGADELSQVVSGLRALGVSEKNFTIDLAIARGLSYYTGTVFETRLEAHPEIGSIASGGRYENLVGTFIDRPMPGVGASIGVTRLVGKLIEAGVLETSVSCIAPVVVLSPADTNAYGAAYMTIANEIRSSGIACENYLVSRALGKQLEYASKRGFKLAIIAGEQELNDNTVAVKNLATGEQISVSRTNLAEHLRSQV